VDIKELLMTAARAVAVYALMLVVIRALGKRTVGNFSAFDLLVALMLGEIVDEMIYGDVRFIQGTVAIVAIAALTFTDSLLSYWDHGMEAVLEGKPTIVIKDGAFERRGMREERMNEKDVLAALRLHGIHDMREVRLAIIEHDGEVSVLPFDWAERVMKADIDKDMARASERALGGRHDPPEDKRSDSARALDLDSGQGR
jgi:uncharacterized membrane protein YcaP (DUF421 family)